MKPRGYELKLQIFGKEEVLAARGFILEAINNPNYSGEAKRTFVNEMRNEALQDLGILPVELRRDLKHIPSQTASEKVWLNWSIRSQILALFQMMRNAKAVRSIFLATAFSHEEARWLGLIGGFHAPCKAEVETLMTEPHYPHLRNDLLRLIEEDFFTYISSKVYDDADLKPFFKKRGYNKPFQDKDDETYYGVNFNIH